jgi:hypothetical protein
MMCSHGQPPNAVFAVLPRPGVVSVLFRIQAPSKAGFVRLINTREPLGAAATIAPVGSGLKALTTSFVVKPQV